MWSYMVEIDILHSPNLRNNYLFSSYNKYCRRVSTGPRIDSTRGVVVCVMEITDLAKATGMPLLFCDDAAGLSPNHNLG